MAVYLHMHWSGESLLACKVFLPSASALEKLAFGQEAANPATNPLTEEISHGFQQLR